jgi:hypothetical protein
MSDGVSVYECTSTDEVVDLLASGQGVFGIALGRISQEVEGTLMGHPTDEQPPANPAAWADRLEARRDRRTG